VDGKTGRFAGPGTGVRKNGGVKIEIWTDIACPFCFIGKRNFEAALEKFAHRDEVEVTWRSFQLDPDLPRRSEGDLHDHLAEKFGRSREEAIDLNRHVIAMAGASGVELNFDDVVVTNTFDAHRLIRMAAAAGKAGEANERLYAAYFTNGIDVGDHAALTAVGGQLGLDTAAVSAALAGDDFATEVWNDIIEAQTLDISAVPAFVIDRQALISGAQKPEGILEALDAMWEAAHPDPTLTVVRRGGAD